MTWNFQYFARLAWKRLFTPQKLGFSGDFTPKMGSNQQCQLNPHKAHPCASPRRLSHQAWKSVDGSDVWVSSWKTGINKKNSLYFTHLPKSPPSKDLHQICHSRRGRRLNHLYQIFWWWSRGVDFVGGRKLLQTSNFVHKLATWSREVGLVVTKCSPSGCC